MEENLIKYIRKSHIDAVAKFNEELKAWAKYTGDAEATLYEDINTSFTLSDLAISNDGQLFYRYDGEQEFLVMVRQEEETGEYYEEFGDEGIMEYIKFWRKCLNRAKHYFSMDSDKLDRMADGEEDDDENEEED